MQIVKPCGGCGREVRREAADGSAFAHVLRDLAAWCDECVAVADAADAEAAARERERARAARHARRRDASGVPPALAGVTFDGLDVRAAKPAADAARRWAAGDLGVLVLHGGVGVGKTTLAAAAANAALARRRVRWLSAPSMLARLMADRDTPARKWVTDALEGSDALVLDDLDKARPSEFGAEQVFLAVDSRLVMGAPLLVTMNLTLREVAQRWPLAYGEAIADRLVTGEVVHVAGTSRRGPIVADDSAQLLARYGIGGAS